MTTPLVIRIAQRRVLVRSVAERQKKLESRTVCDKLHTHVAAECFRLERTEDVGPERAFLHVQAE
ncbi:MAG: hypothetical protein ABSC94_01450 [Polyangiaceae bacterium]